jgi:hypothetical protein
VAESGHLRLLWLRGQNLVSMTTCPGAQSSLLRSARRVWLQRRINWDSQRFLSVIFGLLSSLGTPPRQIQKEDAVEHVGLPVPLRRRKEAEHKTRQYVRKWVGRYPNHLSPAPRCLPANASAGHRSTPYHECRLLEFDCFHTNQEMTQISYGDAKLEDHP